MLKCKITFHTEGVDSADWTGTYGVTETNNGHGITLQFVTHGEYSSNVGSRSYLLAPDEENYYMFYLPNKLCVPGQKRIKKNIQSATFFYLILCICFVPRKRINTPYTL